MTNPNPISKFSSGNGDGEQVEITDKKLLENVPLVISDANQRNSKQYGPFWLVEAIRTDTGEPCVFVGSKVIDKAMNAVKHANGFPVAAMIVKVAADNPQGFYWDLVDPPGTPSAAPSSDGRIEEVQALMLSRGLSVEQVSKECAEVAGKDAKVRDLNAADYEKLLARLTAYPIVDAEPPAEEEPPF